jgi:hypothetical protein
MQNSNGMRGASGGGGVDRVEQVQARPARVHMGDGGDSTEQFMEIDF